jgi:hypothetical protein
MGLCVFRLCQWETYVWVIRTILKPSFPFFMKILKIWRNHPSNFFERSHAARRCKAPIARLNKLLCRPVHVQNTSYSGSFFRGNISELPSMNLLGGWLPAAERFLGPLRNEMTQPFVMGNPKPSRTWCKISIWPKECHFSDRTLMQDNISVSTSAPGPCAPESTALHYIASEMIEGVTISKCRPIPIGITFFRVAPAVGCRGMQSNDFWIEYAWNHLFPPVI